MIDAVVDVQSAAVSSSVGRACAMHHFRFRYLDRRRNGRPPAATEHQADLSQDAAELVPDEAVDDEIDGRVERHQHVGDRVDEPDCRAVAVCDVLVGRRQEFHERDGQTEPDVRQLADNEHADDGHQHHGDALARFGRALALVHRPATTPDRPQCRDQTNVEHGQRHQRADRAKDEEEYGLVDQIVGVVEPKLCLLREEVLGSAAGDVDHFALEEQRNVVDDGQGDDDQDGQASPGEAAQVGLQRLADGREAVGCDQHEHPNGGRLGGRCRRPGVPLHVGEHAAQTGHPGEVPERVQRLDEQTCDQVGRVENGERLEQPVGRVLLIVVPAEDGDRKAVTDKSEQAETADYVHVYGERQTVVEVVPVELVGGRPLFARFVGFRQVEGRREVQRTVHVEAVHRSQKSEEHLLSVER